MGTQQILMIVLSVIVVGAAIAVGIAMFDTQATNQARNAVSSALAQQAVEAQGWFRTPVMMGGGGGTFAAANINQIATHINQNATGASFTVPSGTYTLLTANPGMGTIPTGAGWTHTIFITGTTPRPRGDIIVDAAVGLDGNDENIIVRVRAAATGG